MIISKILMAPHDFALIEQLIDEQSTMMEFVAAIIGFPLRNEVYICGILPLCIDEYISRSSIHVKFKPDMRIALCLVKSFRVLGLLHWHPTGYPEHSAADDSYMSSWGEGAVSIIVAGKGLVKAYAVEGNEMSEVPIEVYYGDMMQKIVACYSNDGKSVVFVNSDMPVREIGILLKEEYERRSDDCLLPAGSFEFERLWGEKDITYNRGQSWVYVSINGRFVMRLLASSNEMIGSIKERLFKILGIEKTHTAAMFIGPHRLLEEDTINMYIGSLSGHLSMYYR